MRYEVRLTEQAIGQIEETVQYISKILLEPEIARKWVDLLQREIEKLDSMPSRYPLIQEELWSTRGIRKMSVRNFLVYFFVDEERKTVWVTAVIYGRRDQIAALTDMTMYDAEQKF